MRDAAMPFRVVSPHVHRAAIGGHTFWCTRQTTATEAGLTTRWTALKDDVLLSDSCPTLNAAKKHCRAALAEAGGLLSGDLVAPPTTRALPPSGPMVGAGVPRENGG